MAQHATASGTPPSRKAKRQKMVQQVPMEWPGEFEVSVSDSSGLNEVIHSGAETVAFLLGFLSKPLAPDMVLTIKPR